MEADMQAGTDARAAEAIAGAIRVDEGAVRSHVAQEVRGTVEETLNALLDAEADAICGAGRYERSALNGFATFCNFGRRAICRVSYNL